MPRKKIFDITPPGENKNLSLPKQPENRNSSDAPKISRITDRKPAPGTLFYFSKKRLFLAVFFTVLSLAGAGYFFIEPEAEIKIWPKTEELSLKTQLLAADSNKEIQVLENLIPSEIIEAESSVSQDFPASGKSLKEEKAKGKIRVYNNYSVSQALTTGTRFWCFIKEGMREFKTQERIVVPSRQYLDVSVIASGAGEEYNIEPCTFSVPGLKGTPRYTVVYGKSLEPMTGGFKAEVPKVTREDMERAKEILTGQALEKSKISLKRKVSENQILLNEAQAQEVVEASLVEKEGQAIDKFSFTVKARSRGIVFKKSDIDNFAKNYILSKIPEDKKLQENSLAINYSVWTIHLGEGKIVLELAIAAKIYRRVDQDLLKKSAKDKTPKQLESIFRNFPEIAKIEVEISPFWAKKIPGDINKIKIKIKLD